MEREVVRPSMLSCPVLYAIHTGCLPRRYFLYVLRSPLPFCTVFAGGCFQFLCCHMVMVHVSHLVSDERKPGQMMLDCGGQDLLE